MPVFVDRAVVVGHGLKVTGEDHVIVAHIVALALDATKKLFSFLRRLLDGLSLEVLDDELPVVFIEGDDGVFVHWSFPFAWARARRAACHSASVSIAGC